MLPERITSQTLTKLSTTSLGNTVLKEANQLDAAIAIGEQLKKIAKLFQVPNWDDDNTVLLTDWIIETYAHESIETIIRALTRPFIARKDEGRTWRLTPDVITEWMEVEMEKEATKRERDIHNAKHSESKIEWSEERLKEWEKVIKDSPGFKPAPKMSMSEIMKEGQEKTQELGYKNPSEEYVITRLIHLEYVKENYLPDGSKRLKWMNEDEWTRIYISTP